MPDIDHKQAFRELDRWALAHGYADFDTYIATGGSFAAAREAIERQRHRLHLAMCALYRWQPKPAPRLSPNGDAKPVIGEEALQRAEAEVSGEPVDADNAQTEGFDHVSA